MIGVILLGFRYEGGLQLPGIVVDLFRAYSYFKSIDAKIEILTDVEEDPSIIELRSSMIDGEVDASVASFISTMKDQGKLHPIYNAFSFRNQFARALEKISGFSSFFIYYTGHGLHHSLVLPNGEFLSIFAFRDALLSAIPLDSQVVWILDCCYSPGLQLSYRFEKSTSTRESRFVFEPGICAPVQEIICISSSTEEEEAVTTQKGSFFSSVFFDFLSRGKRDLDLLVRDSEEKLRQRGIRHPSTTSIVASHPFPPRLWGWVLGESIDLEVDLASSSLKVRMWPKKEDPSKSCKTPRWSTIESENITAHKPLMICWKNSETVSRRSLSSFANPKP